MTDLISPPEGQLSFSGIPSAEFIEDVDSHMASEESAESQLKVLMIKNNLRYFDLWFAEKVAKLLFNSTTTAFLYLGTRWKASKI